MRVIYAFFLLLLTGFVFSVTYINSCQNLSTSWETYVLQNDLPAAGARCFNITALGAALDCNGSSITGPGFGTGVWTNSSFSRVQNCRISNYMIGINMSGSPAAGVIVYPNVINTTLSNQAIGIRTEYVIFPNMRNLTLSNQMVGIYANYTWYFNLSDSTLHNQMVGIYVGDPAWWTDISNVTLYNQWTGILMNITWYTNLRNLLLYNQTTGINISTSWFIDAENITLYNHSGRSAVFGPVWFMNITNYEAYNSGSNALYLYAWFFNLSNTYVHDSGGGTYIFGGYFNVHNHTSTSISEDLYTAAPQYSPGIGLYVEQGSGYCNVSGIYSYNTSSLATYLYDVFNCNLYDVYAEYGAYDGQSDALVSMHGDQSYLDGCPNSNAWNITAVRSYANASNVSGGIGIAVTNGIVENITAHDCRMGGMGIVLGKNSSARNLEAYNNGVVGILVVAGIQNISLGLGGPVPAPWDKSDEGPAEAYNITAYNNGYIGAATFIMNKSFISGIEAYNTGPNYWGVDMDKVCEPFLGSCYEFSYFYLNASTSLNSTTARIGVVMGGFDKNNVLSLPANKSQTGTIQDIHTYNNSIGILTVSVFGAFVEDVSSHDNLYNGMNADEIVRVYFNNLSIYDNGMSGIEAYNDLAAIFAGAEMLVNNSEIYNNDVDGIHAPDITVGMNFQNTRIYDNGRNGLYLPWDWLGEYANVSVYGNGRGGFYSEYLSYANITGSSFYGNGEDGFYAAVIEVVNVTNSTFHHNAGDGFVSPFPVILAVEDSLSHNNEGDGLVLLFYDSVSLDNVTAYGNAGNGAAFMFNGGIGGNPPLLVNNSEIYLNGLTGIVLGLGNAEIANTAIRSNQVGIELVENPNMSLAIPGFPSLNLTPPANTSVSLKLSHLEGNDGDDFLVDLPGGENISQNITVLILNTTFEDTGVTLLHVANNSDPVHLSLSGRTRLPAYPPATYDPLYRMVDIESSTGENISVAALHYTNDDIVGRNLSNLQAFAYHEGAWEQVPMQFHVPPRKYIVFFGFDEFSTVTIFENSTDYRPPEEKERKKEECIWDEDCDPCYICSAHECELPAKACLDDSDCLPGYACTECACTPPECTQDSDCAPGHTCENYECIPPECTQDSDCPSGYSCENYECVAPECMQDSDCPKGQECRNYECVKEEVEEEKIEAPREPQLDIEVSQDPTEEKEVTLIIMDEHGNPVEGAEVLIETKEGIRTTTYGPVNTDRNGETKFVPDTPGDYTAYAKKKGYPDAQKQFRVYAAPSPIVEEEVPAVEVAQQPLPEEAIDLREQWPALVAALLVLIAIIGYLLLSKRRKRKKEGG